MASITANQVQASKGRTFFRPDRLLLYAGLVVMTIIMGFPLYWMISTGLKTEAQAQAFPPELIPNPMILTNFADALARANFGRYVLNSMIVSVSSVALVLFLSSLAGYAFARIRFPGRNLLFGIVLSTMIIPGQVTMIPVFIMIARFPLLGGNDLMGVGGSGLLNTYPGLIIPQLSSAFAIFMMRQFMLSLPEELSDAARIDGASEFGIYWRIMLPLTTPALITLGLFTFTNTWNDFIWPLIVTNSESMRTVQLGLALFRGLRFTEQSLFMAATTLATLPVLILFLLGQRYFIKGVALSGIKG